MQYKALNEISVMEQGQNVCGVKNVESRVQATVLMTNLCSDQ